MGLGALEAPALLLLLSGLWGLFLACLAFLIHTALASPEDRSPWWLSDLALDPTLAVILAAVRTQGYPTFRTPSPPGAALIHVCTARASKPSCVAQTKLPSFLESPGFPRKLQQYATLGGFAG